MPIREGATLYHVLPHYRYAVATLQQSCCPALTGLTSDTVPHYDDVIMGTMASQITSLTIVYSTVYSDADQRNIKVPRHWPLCGEFAGTGEFPAQMASNAKNVSIWWRHHAPNSIVSVFGYIITVTCPTKSDLFWITCVNFSCFRSFSFKKDYISHPALRNNSHRYFHLKETHQ